MITDELLDDLYAHDRARPRSRQKHLGMSQIGTCRRQAQYILLDEQGNGRGSGMAAIVGTALHETIQIARRHRGLLQEQEVRLTLTGGHVIVGHIDEIDVERRIVRDWKGSTEAKIAEVKEYGPQPTYVNQLLLYAAACLEMGILPDNGQPVLLQLVFIDRNGKVPPYCHQFLYDVNLLAEPLDWLHQVREGVETGELMPQDKPVTFCQDYCKFYEICRVPDLSPATGEPIEGEEADDARRYLDLGLREAQVKAARAEIKSRLVGVQGVTPDGITVRWTAYDRDSYTVKAGHVDRLDVRPAK